MKKDFCPYQNRRHAGLLLAEQLQTYSQARDAVIIGLARGGAPVAAELAQYLKLPFFVLVVRKLGYPDQPDLAFGAIAPGNIVVFNEDLLKAKPLAQEVMTAVEIEQKKLLSQRIHAYGFQKEEENIKGKTALIVDDGLATGATLRAALEWAHKQGAKNRIIATPVASPVACKTLTHSGECDACLCLTQPEDFESVGRYYEDFGQVSDEEVKKCLQDMPRQQENIDENIEENMNKF